MKEDEEVIRKAKDTVSKTIKENLDVVKLALDVYNDYLFLLKEKDRIEGFLKKTTFSRELF